MKSLFIIIQYPPQSNLIVIYKIKQLKPPSKKDLKVWYLYSVFIRFQSGKTFLIVNIEF